MELPFTGLGKMAKKQILVVGEKDVGAGQGFRFEHSKFEMSSQHPVESWPRESGVFII